MSDILPRPIADRISFFENHGPVWETNAIPIGTSAAAVTDLQSKTTAARAAFNSQQVAQSAAKDTTLALKNAVDAMMLAGSNIIKSIKTKAGVTGDSVYTLASIPAPQQPTPMGELGKPSEFTCMLSESGVLNLKWKCTNPRGATGVIYQLWRRIGGGEFAYIGGCGDKNWPDSTVPAGSSQVTYQIQAARSTSVGPWAQFNVNFGVSSGGTMEPTVTETKPTKIAA